MVSFVGALSVVGIVHMMWHNCRLPQCCFALCQVCYKIDCFNSYPIVQLTLLLVKCVIQLIVLHLIVTYRTAPCQNVDKTDVNQIYGEYYFSSNNERVYSVSEVKIDS